MFKDTDDGKCVIAVDAAAVNAKIIIHKDGEIEGLIYQLTVDQDSVNLITSKNSELYNKFYMSHREKIIKYFFVYYVCFLDGEK